MSAGQPNWQKLAEMGKLPKEARGQVPILVQLDAQEARLEKIRKGCCSDCLEKFFGDKAEEAAKIPFKCPAPDCFFIGKSEAGLKTHSKVHETNV